MSNEPDQAWLGAQMFSGGMRIDEVDLAAGELTLSLRPGSDVDRILLIAVRLPGEAGVLQRDEDGKPAQIRLKLKHVFVEKADPKAAPPLGLDE